uniref:Biotin carboxyl carrier protein of acetyl-CoA carboxylase n=1 Tax=uncultured bacterium esnapd17 TaxID=1366598 RepID=S5TV43_9BACT|nr:biotin carboxyl carrier protein [uncultured bacterium esnapd17]
MTVQEPAKDLVEVVEMVRDSAAKLLEDVPAVPSTLRVRAGDVSVEMEWPTEVADPATVVAAPAGQQPAGAAPPADDRHLVCAPTVGVFYRAPSPGAQPFVEVGDQVTTGQQIGIVESMKLMIAVEADRPGVVAEILLEDSTPVEYGAPLFALGEG